MNKSVCKCGEPKTPQARHCVKCAVPGMQEALRLHQQAKWKAKYAGTNAEKICPCGQVFYAKTRNVCSTCRRRKRKHKEDALKESRHPIEAVATLREAMYRVSRTNEFGELAVRGWRCVRCGACCTDRKCVKCELEV